MRHPMSIAEQVCRRCGHDFCTDCVVYPFGVAKGAMCIACALEAGGVSRQNTGRPRLSRRQVRERLAHEQPAAPPPEAPEPTTPEPAIDELDEAWLQGEVDPETLGGWSHRF